METSPLMTPDQLMTPAVFADPYPVYRHLRGRTPLSYLAPPGTIPGFDEPIRAWALMRHDDVYEPSHLRIPPAPPGVVCSVYARSSVLRKDLRGS
jgi:hypothetical protein